MCFYHCVSLLRCSLVSHRTISRTEFLATGDEIRALLSDFLSSLIFRGIFVIIGLTRILIDRPTPLSIELRFRLFTRFWISAPFIQ